MFWITWKLWDLYGCEAYDYFNVFCAAIANHITW
jgi:hypothetical protein